jgi:peptidoglycan/LPS O-acetylase OafA/YrhL
MGTVRTLLAISVLITHSELLFGVRLLNGDMAVTCFYIISGFLITLILNEKYAITKVFYINRALRIYVPYFAALAFSIVVFMLIDNPNHDPTSTYSQAVDAHSWLWVTWSTISNFTLVGVDLTRYIGRHEDLSVVSRASSTKVSAGAAGCCSSRRLGRSASNCSSTCWRRSS